MLFLPVPKHPGFRAALDKSDILALSVGGHYEKTGSQITKYYYAGTSRVAMRVNGTLSFLLSDHLGSTSITTNASGTKTSEIRYTAWGEIRYTWGSTPTDYTYTGQYSNVPEFGLY